MSKYLQNRNLSNIKYILYARKSTEGEDRQVASVMSQITVMNEVAQELKLNIIDTISESSSGFKVGRIEFNRMIEKIEKGESDGIVVWKLSRLARNPDDAGRIMGLIQRGTIKHIRTVDRDWFPEDNVVMMYLEFAITNQFSKDLAVDTARGMNEKAERGWCPKATLTLGYQHTPYKKLGTEEIISDPQRLPIITKILKMIASREIAPARALDYATQLGLRNKKGLPVANSTFYRMLEDPFYYGRYEFPKGSGKWFYGKHEVVITEEEYHLIQKYKSRTDAPRPQKHLFPFTGMMKCGECGCSIIIDPKVKVQKNGNVHNFNYYRCTKAKGNCSQKYLEKKKLEKQLLEIISQIEINPVFHEWAIEELKKEQKREINSRDDMLELARKNYDLITEKIDTLVKGWLDKEVPEEAYKNNLVKLERDQNKYKLLLDNSHERSQEWIKKAEKVFNFARDARTRFETGNLAVKNDILMNLGVDIQIKDLKVKLEIDKPLIIMKRAKPIIKSMVKTFEPLNSLENKEEMKLYMSKSLEWGG